MKEVILNISNRKIINLDEFRKAFVSLKDGRYLITIKDMRKRSLPQNAYYWAVVVPLVRAGLYEAGYDEVQDNDDAHEVIKQVHLRKRIVSKQTGDVIDIAGHTKKLTIPEFNDFIERVSKWAAEFLGVVIPAPSHNMAMLNEYIDNHIKIIEDVHTGEPTGLN